MKIRHILIATFASLFILWGCEDDRWYRVPDECEEFVDSFVADAHLNGYDIDIESTGLIIEFMQMNEPIQSELYYKDPLHLIINENIWMNLNSDDRQMLIYKDLAQGYLNRLNKDNKFSNGEYASIMRTELDTSENTHVNFFGFRKTYYIHELFIPQTKIPWWAEYKADFDSITYSNTDIIFSEEHNINPSVLTYDNTKMEISCENSQILIENHSEQDAQIFIEDIIPEDSDWELDCIMKIEISSTGASSGLVFCADDESEWYSATYNPDGRRSLYNKTENHTFCDFPGTDENINYQNTYNEISIRRIGNLIYYFINHEFVYFTDIHEFYDDEAGFYIGAESRVTINRFEVRVN